MARAAYFGIFLLIVAAVVLSGCGSNRQLKSVAVTPATADAKQSPHGQVQFSVVGMFSNSSMPVKLTSQQVTWCYGGLTSVASPVAGMCPGSIAQFATVEQNGVAQCAPAFQGTVLILAGTQPVSMNPDGGSQLKIYGSAQLTCP